MLERKYDPSLPYRFAEYGRMSDPRQNKRSPDQQFATIAETIARCAYAWVRVGTYRDDGISGRYVKKRPGVQKLLRDVEAGLIQVDLIAVDTLERLGRAEEIAELRRRLLVEYGVLIVAADNGFCDPTGIVGKAVGMVEQIRSTENTRISRHNVIRGKKDAARQGHWPGGPRPFGYRLRTVVDDSRTPPKVHSVLEPEPREAAALRLAFERAAATGEGGVRLARWWNSSPEVPGEFRPISPVTMGYRLRNRIYVGELVWGANRTGVVNDTRVIEPNPDGAEVIPGFCPPLVSMELFDRVQELRSARSERIMATRQGPGAAESQPKLIAPQSRGLTLKYLLTGLVRCGCCNASLRPLPSGRRSKAGRRYVYYTCPRHYEAACPNARHVPEDRLREAVVGRLRTRLFPPPGRAGEPPTWLPELMEQVRRELRRHREDEPDREAAAREELKQLEQQVAGWAQSLGNPQRPAAVRGELETRFEEAKRRQEDLERSLAAERALRWHVDRALEPGDVIEQLHQLDEVLAGYNPTLGNLELSRHIDAITCHADGRVELRGTMLGLFEGAVELLVREGVEEGGPAPAVTGDGVRPVRPRRRGRLRLPTLSADGQEALGGLDGILDPERFAGVPDEFFWAETFVLPLRVSWAESHAEEVYLAWEETGLSMEKLANRFGKTRPTIKHALEIAKARRESAPCKGTTAPVGEDPQT
jgi:DNA invertase Pin-like site-specific DNA recombinase